jgi:DNA end-binding protein Ku
MIQAKIDGKEIVSAAEEEPQIIDIMAALKQSIEDSKSERKPMAKAASAKKVTKKAKKAKKATLKKAKVA